jgi:hypothetical protein
VDHNGLLEELKLQALYDLDRTIKLAEWCELSAKAMDDIRAWANPPERSAIWDHRRSS